MVLLPAGSFDMGSSANEVLAACQDYFDKHFTDRVCDRSWFEDEEPLHTITLDDFSLTIMR